MKLCLFTALLSVVAAQKDGRYDSIDTTRGPKLFDPPKSRRGGYTYADEWSVAVNAEMDSQGMAFKGSMTGEIDTTMTVTDLTDGKLKVDLSLENAKGQVQSFVMSIKCDSNDRENSDPDCSPLFDVVGAKESMIVNAAGDILEITTPDGETLSLAPEDELEPEEQVAQQDTLASKFRANQFAAAHHFDKSQQLIKLIPDHAVRPGDSWISDTDMEGMGTFKGDSVLKGYTTYENVDCAIFAFEGTLRLDVTQIAKAIGVEDTSQLPQSEVDAQIVYDIIWDYTDDIARWVQINITVAFDIPNPMNPADPVPVHVPVQVKASLNTDITARPDTETTSGEAQESSYYSPAFQASLINNQDSEEKKGGGWGMGIFFALLVGVGAAGYVVYKKRQEGNDFFVRPTYEFSPVGSEPIYRPNPMV